MQSRIAILALVSVSLLASCSSTPPCDTTTCTGCCSAAGECLPGNTEASCGIGAGTCSACGAGQSCTNGICCASTVCGSTCCAAESTCIDGACCPTAQTCGGSCCAAGSSCVAGACCPAAQACGGSCCNAGATCIQDAGGTRSCAPKCQSSSECAAPATCCVPVSSNDVYVGYGACLSPSLGYACSCKKSTECAGFSGKTACAPAMTNDVIDASNIYLCKPNDGAAWRGCNGSVSCSSPYDCMVDSQGNGYCTRGCTSSAVCGTGCCKPMTCDNAILGCNSTSGCTTCP